LAREFIGNVKVKVDIPLAWFRAVMENEYRYHDS
jgi:hypothetical protein